MLSGAADGDLGGVLHAADQLRGEVLPSGIGFVLHVCVCAVCIHAHSHSHVDADGTYDGDHGVVMYSSTAIS